MSSVTLSVPYVVDGPLPAPPPHRLLDVATILDDPDVHWMNGAQVWSYPSDLPGTHNPCSEGTFRVKADGGSIPLPEFGSFTVYLAATCTARGVNTDEEFRARVIAAFGAVESYGVELELVSGASNPASPFLEDANVDLLNGGAAAGPSVALGLLEDAIGLTARQGMLHVSPKGFTSLAESHLVSDRAGRLTTLRGTPVVIGDGYIGSQPVGGAAPAATNSWAYATGPVQILRSQVEILPGTLREALDRTNNTITYRAERHYLAYWDTVLQSAALITNCGCAT